MSVRRTRPNDRFKSDETFVREEIAMRAKQRLQARNAQMDMPSYSRWFTAFSLVLVGIFVVCLLPTSVSSEVKRIVAGLVALIGFAFFASAATAAVLGAFFIACFAIALFFLAHVAAGMPTLI